MNASFILAVNFNHTESTFGRAPLGVLGRYEREFSRYARMFPDAWFLCVQAEEQMRYEHFQVLFRKHPPPAGTAPRQRWSHIWEHAVDDDRFWTNNLKDKVLSFRTKRGQAAAGVLDDPAHSGPLLVEGGGARGGGGGGGNGGGRGGTAARRR